MQSFVFILMFFLLPLGLLAKPKYGPKVELLRDAPSYLRRGKAPDFWALMPYYVGQTTDASCSTAASAMVLNALRHPSQLSSDDELISHDKILAGFSDPFWAKATASGGNGVTLDQLAELLGKSFLHFQLGAHPVSVRHVEEASAAELKDLRESLKANEKNAKNFMLVNFLQGSLTGDGDAGHFSLVGAYDASRKRVLILDVDRAWYEPYWVSDEELLKAMATRDADAGKQRGFLFIN